MRGYSRLALTVTALALASCGGSSLIRIEESPAAADGGTDAVSEDAAPRVPTSLPGAESARVYIPFETMPPQTTSGALLDVTGTDATESPGAIGLGITPNMTTLSLPGTAADLSTGDFTIAVWIRPRMLTEQPILDRRVKLSQNEYRGYYLGIQFSRIVFEMAAEGRAAKVYHSALELSEPCAWHLVVITVDRSQFYGGRMYLDGRVVSTFVDADQTISSNAPLLVGTTHFPELQFAGSIDEVMITMAF